MILGKASAAMIVALGSVVVTVGCGSASDAATAASLPSDIQEVAVAAIENETEVIDAAISQRGSDLSLVIVVHSLVSQERARQLGENFVRLTKTLAPAEPNPQKEVGKGVYDYTVGVYTPDETRVAIGAKVSFSPRLTW